ncbi:NUDIX hydrolase [Candidatus Woesebacteria bacterium]|nr:NUDIX hydrolase [Candidatus Woesebacteria bacterium]
MKSKDKHIDSFVGMVLLDHNDRIFLIKEDDKNAISRNRWNLPGGSIDGDEDLIEAAKRETKEETGYQADIISMLGCYKCKKGNSSWVYIVFEARITGNVNKKTDPSIKEGKWFKREQFLHLGSDELVHPDMQLVYNVAVEEKGLSINTVKFINYDIQ